MKLHRVTFFAMRKLLDQRNFYLPAAWAAVTVLSLSALLLASASPMSSDSGADFFPPVALPPVAVPAGQLVAPMNISGEAEGSFHPDVLPLVGGMWTAEGPEPIANGQAAAAPNNSVVGAVKAIAAHPSVANTIYVGAVNGGIWKSSDGGKTWTPHTDTQNSLSIGALKFDPTDGSNNTLIAGIGRFSSLDFLGGPRSGVLLTTDGTKWAPPAGGGPGSILGGANITGVAARGKILLASSDLPNRGMYRSSDGGKTFTRISGAPDSGLRDASYLDIAEAPVAAKLIPYGAVLVSLGFPGVEEWSNNGKLITTLSTGTSEDTGSTFDEAGNFYVTTFGNEGVLKFDPTGMLLGPVGPAPGYNQPESVEPDNQGNFYVGNAGFGYVDPKTMVKTSQCVQPPNNNNPMYPPCPLFKFDPTFSTLLKTYYPATEPAPPDNSRGRGIDWLALVPVPSTNPPTPQCVMRYTSEGLLVKQFNVCTGKQLADFASGLPGSNAYELRIAPNGETFVADTQEVVRLDASGNVVGTYLAGVGGTGPKALFALDLDPDGASFWTAAQGPPGHVYKVDIATGKVLLDFTTAGGAPGISIKRSPLYTAVVGAGAADGVYKSKDSGKTWARVSSAKVNDKFIDGTTQNVKLAVGTSGNVFVGIENSGQRGTDLAGLFASPDGGRTWTEITPPMTTEACPPPHTFGINPGGQGERHFSIVADPKNSKIVYVGGDRQPAPNEQPPQKTCTGVAGFPNPNSVGATDYTGRLFRVSDTGFFKSLTNAGTAHGTGPHADSRAMVFDAAGNILEGDDGGIFKRTSPADATGDWSSIIGDLQISEMHDLAFDPVAKVLFGGNQDTGTPSQSATDNLSWNDLLLGDGGDVGVDTTSSAPNSIRYMSFPNAVFQMRTFNAKNAQQGAPVFLALNPKPTPEPQFYTPLRVNSINQRRLLFGFVTGVYESMDQGKNISKVGVEPAGTQVRANDAMGHLAMVYGGRTGGVANADLIYVGSGNSVYRRTAVPSTLKATGALPPGVVSINDLTVDPTDYTHVFATDNNRVYESTNSGDAWKDITGNLTAANPGTFDSMEFVTKAGQKSIVVGTNHGVYRSLLLSLGNWSQLGAGLPNARVFRLRFDSGSGLLVAGTLGRGAWAINLAPTPMPTGTRTPTPTGTATHTATPTPTPIGH